MRQVRRLFEIAAIVAAAGGVPGSVNPALAQGVPQGVGGSMVLPVPQAVPEVFSPLVYCLAGELLAYYLAEIQGAEFFQATRSFRSSGDRRRESHTLRHPDELARMEEEAEG